MSSIKRKRKYKEMKNVNKVTMHNVIWFLKCNSVSRFFMNASLEETHSKLYFLNFAFFKEASTQLFPIRIEAIGFKVDCERKEEENEINVFSFPFPFPFILFSCHDSNFYSPYVSVSSCSSFLILIASVLCFDLLSFCVEIFCLSVWKIYKAYFLLTVLINVLIVF